MGCSYISHSSYFGSSRIGLGIIFWWREEGRRKIGSLPEVKNLTDKAKTEFDSIIGNSTLDIIAITESMNSHFLLKP